MIASSALSRAYAIIYQTNPIYLYSTIDKYTNLTVPSFPFVLWMPLDGPSKFGRFVGRIYFSSLPKIKKGITSFSMDRVLVKSGESREPIFQDIIQFWWPSQFITWGNSMFHLQSPHITSEVDIGKIEKSR